METCASVINALLFCVSYTLAGLSYSVKEKSQTVIELMWDNSVGKGETKLVLVFKDSLQMRERVELATNKVRFWGTQNDTVRSNQEMILDVTH